MPAIRAIVMATSTGYGPIGSGEDVVVMVDVVVMDVVMDVVIKHSLSVVSSSRLLLTNFTTASPVIMAVTPNPPLNKAEYLRTVNTVNLARNCIFNTCNYLFG